MSEGTIRPGQGGGNASEDTRKVVGGWHAMKEGKRESRQQRLMREQQERSERVKQGLPAEKDNSFRPGQEESSEEFSMKRMKEHAQKMAKKNVAKSTFVGSAEMVTMKLVVLFNPENGPAKKITVLGVEEAGFGKYKLTYLID